ncbi:hypothetical protein LY78DRAFT_365150 [Colletotrichum sublineola]|nr:hypothetical protein LY78DRAFT_365150 [Colletotrichum sublineola]
MMWNTQQDPTLGKARLEETRPELHTAAVLTKTERVLQRPPRHDSRPSPDPALESENYRKLSVDPSYKPAEMHLTETLSTEDRPGKHALRGRTNAALRRQQGGPIAANPVMISHSSRKHLGRMSRITRGPMTKLKRNRDSKSLQPRSSSQNANSRDIERSADGFGAPSEFSSRSKFPVYSDSFSLTSRTQNPSPYLRRLGTVSGSVEVDRTISKDNTGGEAARLASLLAKFGASRRPDIQQHHIPSKRPSLDGTSYNSGTTPAADSDKSLRPPTPRMFDRLKGTPVAIPIAQVASQSHADNNQNELAASLSSNGMVGFNAMTFSDPWVSDNALNDLDFDSFYHSDGDN